MSYRMYVITGRFRDEKKPCSWKVSATSTSSAKTEFWRLMNLKPNDENFSFIEIRPALSSDVYRAKPKKAKR
jgi:hypothetical protein